MKALVIFSHPSSNSFNAAILGVVKRELLKSGADVKIKDLYTMNWNPVLSEADFQEFLSGKAPEDIATEQADVSWADVLIVITPVWWFSIPAILKGYFDRVMARGFAYQHTESGPQGLLQGKRAVVITTSGSTEEIASATGMMESLNTSLVGGIFGCYGFSEIKYKNCFAVPIVSDDQRKAMLEDVRELIKYI